MYKKLTLLCLVLITLAGAKVSCSAAELLEKTNFKDGISLPWMIAESNELNSYSKVVDGEYMVHIDLNGTYRGDVQLRHRGISLVAGHTNDCTAPVPQEIYFTEMSLTDDQFSPTPRPTPTPARDIRINQLGYYPNAEKKATLRSSSADPIDVLLKDSEGKVVWTGKSIPKGADKASGDDVHIIDFSDFNTPGTNYQLFTDTASSFPFDIAPNIYSQMKYDALKYFYYARSGIEINMPYCAESKWARPAAHLSDKATLYPNKPFIEGNNTITSIPSIYTGGPSSLDLTGGWYDAGDHGKYVIQGGIATWSLQNQYELAKVNGKDSQYADGKLNIPESGNNVPDILDEARWNIEFMLKTQIPEGFNKAGMAVYEVADELWTEPGVGPEQDTQKRYFYPPSTKSTLYLAAVAAQASRLWEPYDKEFSQRCLTAAETAWEAALANPEIHIPYPQELAGETIDDYLPGDFYWAACELYATTGKSVYYDYIKKSEYFLKINRNQDIFQNYTECTYAPAVSGFGTLTLSVTHPGSMPLADISTAKANILALADMLIAIQQKEGYGIPLSTTTYVSEFGGYAETITDGYALYSNLYIANNSMVLAYAHDLSHDTKYINGISESLDYLMGRNPLIKSYITGYGDNPVKYAYNNLFSYPTDSSQPLTPAGFLVGGPNSGLQDSYAHGGILRNTPPQKCYMDNAESWSTNETTINLNASFAWLTGYIDGVLRSPVQAPSWDINADGAVNMEDVMLIARCFNSKNGDAKYDEKCDLDGDGVINMTDVMVVAKYFGQTYSYN